MKTTILILSLILFVIRPLPAQTDSVILKPYRIWVKPIKRAPNIDGILYEIRDSSILISAVSAQSSYNSATFAGSEVWSKDIKQIDLRKKGVHGTAVLIGGVAGAVIGVIVGLLSGSSQGSSDMDKEFSKGAMVVFPLLCAGVGAGIGGMVGGAKLKIPIHGSQAELERNRYRLEGYSLKKQPYKNRPGADFFSRLRDTLTDVDGNVYHLLALGGQVWMAENLKVTRFRDSTAIPGTSIRKLTNEIHYNWNAVSDVRNICPAGWHVPSQFEWNSLCSSLGGEANAAGNMDGIFTPKGWTAQWWSSTVHPKNAGCFYVNAEAGSAVYTVQSLTSFLPVRCIRDY
jgi:hypothetical protein